MTSEERGRERDRKKEKDRDEPGGCRARDISHVAFGEWVRIPAEEPG